jgi:hypothetical protein
MMVDVVAIFDDVFGPGERDKGLSENRCVRCVGVSDGDKPLENHENPNTPTSFEKHTSNQGVCEVDSGCVRYIVENQDVAGGHTPTHHTHPKSDNPIPPVDIDVFAERTALIHEAHTIAVDSDGQPLAEPVYGLSRQQAETLAAQEQGHGDANSLHGDVIKRWATEIDRLASLKAVSADGTKAPKSAQAFIAEGWALQAARLGWDEVELFGISPTGTWMRLDRKGVAFGGAVQAVTAEAVAYIGGLRRFKAQVNNDGGAVPIWELEQNNPSNEGNAA